jgi:hypothetical protein
VNQPLQGVGDTGASCTFRHEVLSHQRCDLPWRPHLSSKKASVIGEMLGVLRVIRGAIKSSDVGVRGKGGANNKQEHNPVYAFRETALTATQTAVGMPASSI